MKKADFILIAVVVAVAGVLLFFLYGANNNSGAYVRLEIDGKVTETLPLDVDAIREIETDDNATNTLVIKDGYAKMIDANCPDGLCTNQKKISRNGESIICLPHKVVVSVVDDNSDEQIDAVA
ncbi:MAG: NusG domain II-containing protein [Eubacterium sp.]|nr:NusG domain II-containing protein [Eubacterium sp.]MDE6155875.1 NusG domain II-containing protein [Eubacterium sp.]MDE6767782.1 NusG domain II-containing protein [Eubacterium sp.]